MYVPRHLSTATEHTTPTWILMWAVGFGCLWCVSISCNKWTSWWGRWIMGELRHARALVWLGLWGKRSECSRLWWSPSKDKIKNNLENGELIKVWSRVVPVPAAAREMPFNGFIALTTNLYCAQRVSGMVPAAGLQWCSAKESTVKWARDHKRTVGNPLRFPSVSTWSLTPEESWSQVRLLEMFPHEVQNSIKKMTGLTQDWGPLAMKTPRGRLTQSEGGRKTSQSGWLQRTWERSSTVSFQV